MGQVNADRVNGIEWGAPTRYIAAATDEDLVQVALVDASHFNHLYERYADRLYRYAIGRTRSPEIADDIVSETMISALESLERFNPQKGSFATWIFTIARRRIADRGRVHHRFWRYVTRQPESSPTDDLPLEAVIRDEERTRVQDAVEQLSDNHREVVLLRYVAERPIGSIANVLDISEGAVKMRLQRALKNLASELEGDEQR